MKTLKDLFLAELKDMYDAEHRIIKALPKMAKAATCNKVKEAFLSHLKETEGHVAKLEQVFTCFGEKAVGEACEGTMGLLKEGDELAADFKGSPAINAALISAAQKVEHYEMASYGCLREWAELLGCEDAAHLLQGILDEEKAANTSLTELSREKNREALGKSNEAAKGDQAKAGPDKASNAPRREARAAGAAGKRAAVLV